MSQNASPEISSAAQVGAMIVTSIVKAIEEVAAEHDRQGDALLFPDFTTPNAAEMSVGASHQVLAEGFRDLASTLVRSFGIEEGK
jgi:hypothetical protein